MRFLFSLVFMFGCASLERPSQDSPPVDPGPDAPPTVVFPPDAPPAPPDTCPPPPPECECDRDCGEDQVCREGECHQTCQCDFDCGNHNECRSHVCYNPHGD